MSPDPLRVLRVLDELGPEAVLHVPREPRALCSVSAPGDAGEVLQRPVERRHAFAAVESLRWLGADAAEIRYGARSN